jgi:hypothetical protein
MTVESETHAGRGGGILPPRDARGRRPGNGNLARKVMGTPGPRATRLRDVPRDRLFKCADKNKRRAIFLEHFSRLWQRGHRLALEARKSRNAPTSDRTILGEVGEGWRAHLREKAYRLAAHAIRHYPFASQVPRRT